MANQPKNNAENTKIAHNPSDHRWLIFSGLIIFVVYLLSPILTPFLIAAVLAYICDPLVDRLSVFKLGTFSMGRTIATVLVLMALSLAIILMFLIIIPLLQKQSMLIAERLPSLIDQIRQTVEPWLQSKFGISLAIDSAHVQDIISKNWKTTGDILGEVLKQAGTQGLAFIGLLANLFLLPVVLFFLLRDWDELVANVGELIPRDWIDGVTSIAKEVDQVVAEFLRGQLSVMFALGIFYSVGLWLAGLEMALSIGLIAGLLSFIPYLGFALAFIMAVALALLQFSSFAQVVPVLIVFGLGQFVESFVLTPILVGHRIGLHPVVVILALLAGGQLFGFAGVLLALPVSAAIAVGLRHTRDNYLSSDTYLN
ncbi:MAG: AI-2E family transporter [Methylophilaceae bacterium 17-44-8]|jgi:predicted PurR-regulated permease PerM|nr:MAG: AI-2E family transporter [Methylophilales bacterium 28-44-11]OZA05052.1 MAG: AI-2E family transporter [Methylophilaceae bacterium 17-44-8]